VVNRYILDGIMITNLVFASSLQLLGFAMIAMGLALAVVTAWFWKSARPETEALAPLEIMGERQFVSASDDLKKQLLNSVRAKPAIEQRPSSDNN